MSLKRFAPLADQRGIGLVIALFAVVFLSLFGLLAARYTLTTTQISSSEDYLWAQALYSAESVMRLNILSHDGGGGLGGITVIPTNVQGFDFTPLKDGPARVTDDFRGVSNPSTIKVQARHPTGISREIEVKYVL